MSNPFQSWTEADVAAFNAKYPKVRMSEKTLEDMTKLVCECCGLEVNRKPWPEGWWQTGTSRRFVDSSGRRALASWCPEHIKDELVDAAPISESDLHDQISAECKRRGWIAFHGAMSERTARTLGEPDYIVLADHGRVFFIEAKTAKAKLRPEQLAIKCWAEKLGHTVHVVRSFEEFLQIVA